MSSADRSCASSRLSEYSVAVRSSRSRAASAWRRIREVSPEITSPTTSITPKVISSRGSLTDDAK
jgi:hypothetical protein